MEPHRVRQETAYPSLAYGLLGLGRFLPQIPDSYKRVIFMSICGSIRLSLDRTFLLVSFSTFGGLDVREASGQTKVVNIAGAGAALVTFALAGQVDWHLGLIAGLFGIAGHYLGATLVVKNGTAIVRPIILVVLLALFAKTLWQYFA